MFHIFFWVGTNVTSVVTNENFESSMREISEFSEGFKSKIRIRVEFLYAESPQFFALFSSLNLKNQPELEANFQVIQYQEYKRQKEDKNPERAISFPKILILDLANSQHSNLISYVRIFERKNLDHDLTTMTENQQVYFYLEGCHLNEKQQEVSDMSVNSGQITEHITKVDLLAGANAPHKLT